VLLVSYVAGQQPSAGDVERLTEHSALWRQQLEKLQSRLASLTIEPPTRPQSRRIPAGGAAQSGLHARSQDPQALVQVVRRRLRAILRLTGRARFGSSQMEVPAALFSPNTLSP
jgi:hypothetical protein